MRSNSAAQFALPSADGAAIVPVCGTVEDLDFLKNTLAAYRVETVFHLAAINDNASTAQDPISLLTVNIRGVYNLLEAARCAKTVGSVVIASSTEVERIESPARAGLGDQKRVSIYQASKISAELLAKSYHDSYGTPAAVIRFCNIYGGGDFNWRRLVPSTIRSIGNGERPGLYPTALDLKSYTYVDDAVDALLTLGMTGNAAEIGGEVFVLDTGDKYSAADIMSKIGVLMGRPDLLSDLAHLAPCDPLSADEFSRPGRALPNWQSVIGIDEGLSATTAWYRAYFDASTNSADSRH